MAPWGAGQKPPRSSLFFPISKTRFDFDFKSRKITATPLES